MSFGGRLQLRSLGHHCPALDPSSTVGLAGFGLAALGVVLCVPRNLTDPEAQSLLADVGSMFCLVGAGVALFALIVARDRSWPVILSVPAIVVAGNLLLSIAATVIGVALAMNIARHRWSRGMSSNDISARPLADSEPPRRAVPRSRARYGSFAVAAAVLVAAVAVFVTAFAGGNAWSDTTSLGELLVFGSLPLLILTASTVIAVLIQVVKLVRRRQVDRVSGDERRATGSVGGIVVQTGTLVLTIAAHLAAAFLCFALAFVSSSGLLDMATLVGVIAAFVGVWWLRQTHPVEACIVSWLVPGAVIGVIVIADNLGLLGA